MEQLTFSKSNYKLLGISGVVILVGFALMYGGGSSDPNVFSEDIFSFRRITLAPFVLLIGYGLAIYAILKRSAK